MFSDNAKFSIIKNYPTLTRFKTVQNYSNNSAKVVESPTLKRSRRNQCQHSQVAHMVHLKFINHLPIF